jgi:protein CpxP
MKKQAITYIFIGAMLATGILCGRAFADMDNKTTMVDRQERMEMKHEKQLEMMADLLDLTEAQQEQIRSIHEQERDGHEGLRQQMHDSHEQMRALLDSDTFDESAIRNLATSQASLKTEMFVSRAKVKHQVFQLLNSDQQVLAKKIQPLLRKQDGHRSPQMEF